MVELLANYGADIHRRRADGPTRILWPHCDNHLGVSRLLIAAASPPSGCLPKRLPIPRVLRSS
jgi:hypothetical protein